MRHTLFLFLLAALFACKTRKEMPAAAPADDRLISLATQGCRGWCPTYVLDFYSSGKVQYEGIRYVEKSGKSEFQLTVDELTSLKDAVKKADLWQYPEHIESRVADAPYATLTVYNAEKTHPVSGSIDRPRPLLELENRLKDLAEAHGLQVKKGVNPNDPALKMTAMLVVKLKPDINAGNWAKPLQDESLLRLVRRVSSENNWMIGYDPNVHTEQEMIEMLKGLEGVVGVEKK